MQKSFSVKEPKVKYFLFLLFFGILLPVSWLMISSDSIFWGLISGVFALLGVIIFTLKLLAGTSGMEFFPDHFVVSLSNKRTYSYNYSDLAYIGVQELKMPGAAQTANNVMTAATVVTAPLNVLLTPEVYQREFMALAFGFNPSVEGPRTSKLDTFIFSKDRMFAYSDENKADLYLFLYINIKMERRKELFEYLINIAHLDLKVLPALELK